MGDAGLMAGSLGALGLFLVVDVLLLADALYQVVLGRPSLLRLQRLIQRREPATTQDCVYEGASKAFTGVGLTTLVLPMAIVQLITLLAATPLAYVPRQISLLLMAGWVGCFVLAMTCFVLGLALALRVKYVRVGDPEVSRT